MQNNAKQMSGFVKVLLYLVIFSFILLFGGIIHQIVIGISMINISDELMEKGAYVLLSAGSIEIIVIYILFIASGILFTLFGPYKLNKDRWFLITFLLFVIWVPVDIYTISLDIRFAANFDIGKPLTNELKELFIARRNLGPLPGLTLISYLVGIGFAIFKPNLKKKTA